jgi:hypothetical protein
MTKDILTYEGGKDHKKAQEWMETLIKERSLIFHPDTRAEEYVHKTTGSQTFNDEEIQRLNRSLRDLFNIFGEDVYRISLLAVGLEAD